MNSTEMVSAANRGQAWLRTSLARLGGSYRLPIYVTCSLLAVVVSCLAGKDMAWDTLHYHLYAGFSALHDRLTLDYFAAGPQSYLNPYIYLPFYELASSGLSALAAGSILALVQSGILWLSFELTLTVCPSRDPRTRIAMGCCGALLAAVNPILLQQIGSSFADVTTSEVVVAGWLLLALSISAPGKLKTAGAGILLGVAAALKLTNALPAIAGAVVLVMLPLPGRRRLGHCALYGLAVGASFIVVAGPWAYRLERQFGNPFFPLLNGIFRSPEFTTEPLRQMRFVPSGLGGALWRPFAMLNPVPMIQEEFRSPDLRYALLVVLAVVLLVKWVWKHRRRGSVERRPGNRAARVLVALTCGFVVNWAIWLWTSGNGRYFIYGACVAGVIVTVLIFRLFSGWSKLRNYALLAVLLVQAVQLAIGADLCWNRVPWDGGKWFEIQVPNELAKENNLYLTIGAQSNSFLIPYLAQGSAFVNVAGGYPLGADGPSGERIKSLIRRYGTHIRMLVRGAHLYSDTARRYPSLSGVDNELARFGLRADPSRCSTITVLDLPPELQITFVGEKDTESTPPDRTFLVSCRVVRDDSVRAAWLAGQVDADIILDRLEDACPMLFQPRRPLTGRRGDSWTRSYMNTDLMAWVSHGWVEFTNVVDDDGAKSLGRASQWLRAPPKLICGRRDGHYFAKIAR